MGRVFGLSPSSPMTQKDMLAKVPEMAQRQDSVTEQVKDLLAVATKMGMYDARDWLREAFFARWETERSHAIRHSQH